MTRCEIHLDGRTGKAIGKMEIDLVRLIGSPEAYFAVSQSRDAEIAKKWQADLLRGVGVLINGESTPWDITGYAYPDLPLEKFTEPWAAPMSTVDFEFELPELAENIQIQTDPRVPVEHPFVVTFRDSLDSERRQTRWLAAGQTSPGFEHRPALIEPSPAMVRDAPVSESKSVEQTTTPWSWLGTFIGLGFIHIIPRGWDHILFILGLFFLGQGLREKILHISLFTLAHTVSLGLTMFGYVPSLPDIVEPLIAASIVYVGLSNLRPQMRLTHKWHAAIIFAVGLLHGMGFAGVLSTYPIPSDAPLLALAAFNFGVELGQLCVLLIAYVLLKPLFSWKGYTPFVCIPINLLIALVAAFWTLQRIHIL
ncbi:MAG: HupE/UreJ family protein [Opitutales bacterium]